MRKRQIVQIAVLPIILLTAYATGLCADTKDEPRPRGIPAEQWVQISENFGLHVTQFTPRPAPSDFPTPQATSSTPKQPPPANPDLERLRSQIDNTQRSIDELPSDFLDSMDSGVTGQFYLKLKGQWFPVSVPIGGVVLHR